MAERKHKKAMKGMSVKSGDKRPTKSGAGMTKKGVAPDGATQVLSLSINLILGIASG